MSSSTLGASRPRPRRTRGGRGRRRRVAVGEVALAGDGDRLGDGERREEPGVLERATEAGDGPLVRLPVGDVEAAEADPAALDRQEPRDAVHQRGLAGAVVADEPDDLAVASSRSTSSTAVMPPKRLVTPRHARTTSASSADDPRPRRPSSARPASSSRLVASRRAGGTPAMNTERRMSGRSRRSRVGPGEAELALLHEHRPLGEVQGDVDRLLDDDDRGAPAVDLATTSSSWATIVGARPSENSSIISSSGRSSAHRRGEHLLLAAGEVAGQLAGVLEDREQVDTSARAATRSGSSRNSQDARRRFSATESVGNTPLPPGMSAAPWVMRSARGTGDVLAVEGHGARLGRHQPADRLEQRGLAGAVGAEQGDDLAAATSRSTPKRTWSGP